MGFSCGLVGLPNVGKSTIFNALSHGGAASANFPFCTIEPNTGVVGVPDPRLAVLAKLENSVKVVPTSLKFIDIAGLVEGASQGEGLGNQFLGHIRQVDAICHVVRLFDDADVVHVGGDVDPIRDLELIQTELLLSDLELVEKRLNSKKTRGVLDPETKLELEIARELLALLNEGVAPARHKITEEQHVVAQAWGLLSAMPAFVIANVDENNLRIFGKSEKSKQLIEYAKTHDMSVVPVCGKLEEELSQLDESEAAEFLADFGITESGLNRVIHTGYALLNYITFFTTGPTETHAWTITQGTKAPQAAGKIHSDMERGFIRMEVVSYNDLVTYGNWNKAKEAGKLRIEGKDYIVKDGDSIFIRFAV